ncbi:AlpA family transcriptional regulator [Sulfurivirga sp.]|uniref:helix-turn-helix transcriptional regulator n=1 Tax=Sulfurivirga sp. TaxID=2614236 RepID=UPI0025FD1424|nr:AlpA family transcriptional regulator [Sulfurivirga sp.]
MSEVIVMSPDQLKQLVIDAQRQALIQAGLPDMRRMIEDLQRRIEGQTKSELMRLKEVCQETGLSQGTIYRLMSEGKFPQSVKIGPRSVAWKRMEVYDWIRSRQEGKTA